MLDLDAIADRILRRPPRTLDGASEWSRAAVAAVFRDGDRGAELLFIQRAAHPRDPWSGQVGFPGGRAEDHDATLQHTAARETLEELGLDLLGGPAAPLGALDELQARSRQKIAPMAIHPHAFAWRAPVPPLILDRTEVASAFWVPLTELADPGRRGWFDAERADAPYRFPTVDLGPGRTLWGLTHRMVHEILDRLELIDDVDELTRPQLRAGAGAAAGRW